MNPQNRFALPGRIVASLTVILSLATISLPAQSTGETNAPLRGEEVNIVTAAQLEAMVQLQAQQEATLKALESIRSEIANSLATSLSNNVGHLNAMSEMFAHQRAQDMRVLRDSNRVMLAVVIGLAGLLLLSILFLNVTSIRAINRLATVFQASALLPPPEGAVKPASRQLLLFPGEEGQRQLGSALLQLQSRIQILEHLASRASTSRGSVSGTVGSAQSSGTGNGENQPAA